MSSVHELARGRESLRGLIEYALADGWRVVRTPDGALRFVKPGSAAVYTVPAAGGRRGDFRPVRQSAFGAQVHPADGLSQHPRKRA